MKKFIVSILIFFLLVTAVGILIQWDLEGLIMWASVSIARATIATMAAGTIIAFSLAPYANTWLEKNDDIPY